MSIRKAEAVWEGDLVGGKGTMKTESGALAGAYSFRTRMEDEAGTNPEELIGAAHAGCFSMALAAGLAKAGHRPERIHTEAEVHFGKVGEGFKITSIHLRTRGLVPGLGEADFVKHAEDAKRNCPVSQARAGTRIELDAALER